MEIAVLGIDLGKTSWQRTGLDGAGRVVLRRRMHRDGVAKLAAGLPASLAADEHVRHRWLQKRLWRRTCCMTRARAQWGHRRPA